MQLTPILKRNSSVGYEAKTGPTFYCKSIKKQGCNSKWNSDE
jgi:hypothetical protein